ncbi:DUF3850 domain-containing protein [Chryseobacterium sp. 09-1422]|uniref:DUF3850 domain-containing protein n=1 Tax=Chryseobacterium kimseyorum TaxID=2984028 RepID=A0ABT3HZ16_9FLAO|nr:DUF3850 domain-containing protein [Chryseobacterium kimseyorum]MCW3168935.1 DUF3850 domain-containing protein [Chryseobacterium kimseyorum]
MTNHKLKLQQPYFDDVYYNRKEFEVRKNDRNYKVGDRLVLFEYPTENPNSKYVMKDVKYILEGGQFGVEKGYVILGLADVPFAEPLSEIIKKDLQDKMTFQFAGRGQV